MSLIEKIRKNSTISEVSILSQSKFFNEKDMVDTGIPMLNVALSGRIDGGLTPGLTMFAANSKHFKTGFSLYLASRYLKKYPESVMMLFDSEFGSPLSYFKTFEIDTSRVIHIPIMNIEQLKFECVKQLDGLTRGDKVISVVDSIGNLASKKELDDALEESSKQDMTRARQLKSFFRMITPYLNIKDIPMIVVNHIYKEQGSMYPKDIVSGGTGGYLSSDNIFIIGRQQEKDGKDLIGYDFVINVEKSRYVKEKSKIPISISYENGIQKYSGLLDLAIECGLVDNSSKGWYSKIDTNTGEVLGKMRERDTYTSDFWKDILENDIFQEYVKKKYSVAYSSVMNDNKEDIND